MEKNVADFFSTLKVKNLNEKKIIPPKKLCGGENSFLKENTN